MTAPHDDETGVDDDEFAVLLDEYDTANRNDSAADFWIQRPCTDEMRSRVEQAYHSLNLVDAFLNQSTQTSADPILVAPVLNLDKVQSSPVTLDRFELIRELGRGGFGIVFLANDPVLNRQVAIKIPRLDAMHNAALRQRFANESEIAASLDHAHIVPLFEVGNSLGNLYIVSLYCPGTNLAQWLEMHRGQLSLEQIVELMICLADATAYCHLRNVLHRDLKPANVLLFPQVFRSLPFLPRINDFGLAKVLESSMSDTASSLMLGTPLYMSPEQASSQYHTISPATDVYALGTILYELLTGEPPFRGAGIAETLDLIRTKAPVNARSKNPQIPRDLETICLKCLCKEPTDRYASALQLLSDLRAFADGQRISARRLSYLERIERWTSLRPRIHEASWIVFAVNAIVLSALVVSLLIVLFQFLPVQPSHRFPVVISCLAMLVFVQVPLLRVGRSIYFGKAWAAAVCFAGGLSTTGLSFAYLLGALNVYPPFLISIPGFRIGCGVIALLASLQTLACAVGWHAITHTQRLKNRTASSYVRWLVVGSFVLLLATGMLTITELISAVTRKPNIAMNELTTGDSPTKYARYASDLRKAADLIFLGKQKSARTLLDRYAAPGSEASLQEFAWRYLDTRLRQTELTKRVFQGSLDQVLCSDISPDMQWIVGADRKGRICVWEAASGRLVRDLKYAEREVNAVEFSPDGKWLATTGQDSKVHLWNCESWQEESVLAERGGTNTGLAWSPDSLQIACSNRHNQVSVWDTRSGEKVVQLHPISDVVRDVDWSRDGKFLAANIGGLVSVWDVADWKQIQQSNVSEFALHSLSFSPNNRQIVSVGYGTSLNLLSGDDFSQLTMLNAVNHMQNVNWSPDGQYLIGGLSAGGPRLWSVSSAKELITFDSTDETVRTAKFSSDCRKVLSASEEGSRLTLWDLESVLGFSQTLLKNKVLSLYADDERTVYAYNDQVNTVVFDQVSGQPLLKLDKPTSCAALGPKANRFARDTSNGIEIWSVESKTQTACLSKPEHQIAEFRFTADGTHLVAQSRVNDWTLYNIDRAEPIAQYKSSSSHYQPMIGFSADGRIFAVRRSVSIGDDCFDLNSVQDGTTLRSIPLNDENSDIALDSEAKKLIVAAQDGIVVCDLQLAESSFTQLKLQRNIDRIALSPDGASLAITVKGEGLFLWDTRAGEELFPVLKTSAEITELRFTTNNVLHFMKHEPAGTCLIVVRCKASNNEGLR